MFDAIDFKWNEEKKGLVVERRPIYFNEKIVDETISVSLDYRSSNFKSRKAMYSKILEDVETLKNGLIKIQKNEVK